MSLAVLYDGARGSFATPGAAAKGTPVFGGVSHVVAGPGANAAWAALLVLPAAAFELDKGKSRMLLTVGTLRLELGRGSYGDHAVLVRTARGTSALRVGRPAASTAVLVFCPATGGMRSCQYDAATGAPILRAAAKPLLLSTQGDVAVVAATGAWQCAFFATRAPDLAGQVQVQGARLVESYPGLRAGVVELGRQAGGGVPAARLVASGRFVAASAANQAAAAAHWGTVAAKGSPNEAALAGARAGASLPSGALGAAAGPLSTASTINLAGISQGLKLQGLEGLSAAAAANAAKQAAAAAHWGTVAATKSPSTINLAGIAQGLKLQGLEGLSAAAAANAANQAAAAAHWGTVAATKSPSTISFSIAGAACPAGTLMVPVRVRLVAAQANYNAIDSQWAQVQYYAAGEYALMPGYTAGFARLARVGNSPSGTAHHDRHVYLGVGFGPLLGLPAETTAAAVFVDSDLVTKPSLYNTGAAFSTAEQTWRAPFIGLVGLRATAEYACVPANSAAYVAAAPAAPAATVALRPTLPPACTVTRVTIADCSVYFAEGDYRTAASGALGHATNDGSDTDRWVLLGNVGSRFGLGETLAVVVMGKTADALTPLIYSPYTSDKTNDVLSASARWLYPADATPVRAKVTVQRSCVPR
jgi:hypothetical protein